MSSDHESLDNIRINTILERINNEIEYLKEDPSRDTVDHFNCLLEQKKNYEAQLNSSETSPIDNVIKSSSLSMSPEQVITSTNDLNKFIDGLKK